MSDLALAVLCYCAAAALAFGALAAFDFRRDALGLFVASLSAAALVAGALTLTGDLA